MAADAEPAPPRADLNLVLAVIQEQDALKARGERFLAGADLPPVVPFAVGIELLLWCRKRGAAYVPAVTACAYHFELEQAEVLLTAAQALERGEVRSPFDAVHLAEAFLAGVPLVTADERLWRTRYPTARF